MGCVLVLVLVFTIVMQFNLIPRVSHLPALLSCSRETLGTRLDGGLFKDGCAFEQLTHLETYHKGLCNGNYKHRTIVFYWLKK